MKFRLLINGDLVDGADAMEVIDPTRAEAFERSPRGDTQQAETAIAAAQRAQRPWAELGFEGRRPYLEGFADALDRETGSIAEVLTRERGGPLADCEAEVRRAAAAIRYFAGQVLVDRVLRDTSSERIVAQRYPQGVVAAITPWNRPMTLLSFKVGPALITGNTVIAKPAPTTPLSTLMWGEIAAGIFPAGVFQTLTDLNDLGPLLTSHPGIAHVSFTGSTPTGKRVLSSAAETLKRFTLELGGNDAAIVLDDADVEWAAERIFASAMINAGQVCYAAKRVYAPRALTEPLAEALAGHARAAVLGDGRDPATTMGPLQNAMQFEKLKDILADARRAGGQFTTGGEATGQGYFIRPAIVSGLSDTSRLVREEQFGPALPVLPYDTIDEAVARANNSEYGLGGTIWTGQPERGIEIASRIETGTIWVNKHFDLPLEIPFGGAKESGLGLQNGIEGLEDFTQLRILNANMGENP